MSITFDLYTRWKALKGFASDRAALAELGVSHGAAVHWKDGRNADAAVIEHMAKDLGENAMLMVALAMKEQSKGESAKTWARFAKQLGAAAALVFVALFPSAKASAIATVLQAEQAQDICIMRNRFVRLLRRLAAPVGTFRLAIAG